MPKSPYGTIKKQDLSVDAIGLERSDFSTIIARIKKKADILALLELALTSDEQSKVEQRLVVVGELLARGGDNRRGINSWVAEYTDNNKHFVGSIKKQLWVLEDQELDSLCRLYKIKPAMPWSEREKPKKPRL